jgi:hypothetical protein
MPSTSALTFVDVFPTVDSRSTTAAANVRCANLRSGEPFFMGYLFAGSIDGAKRLATAYTLVTSCRALGDQHARVFDRRAESNESGISCVSRSSVDAASLGSGSRIVAGLEPVGSALDEMKLA